ncbi:MAG: hypothetical protein A2Y77_08910 [Planctomycetes bacterium RBG_13_62_9]|nr:MAG: hypothetical protein A2Y77_08910 [Planctomycetes bacterium RBG_13_62_9]
MPVARRRSGNPQFKGDPIMVTFSNDADILKYEPVLFGELHLPGQVLASGTGAALSGTMLTAADADFTSSGVSAGGVVHLRSADGALDGAYEIVSVDSATALTISVVRSDTTGAPVAPPSGENISYRISTFAPQASEAAFRLTEHFGIHPGNPTSEIAVEDIVDTEGLRRVSTFAVISAAYATWAAQTDGESFWKKSRYYQQLFEDARQRCHLSADLGSDAVADITRLGGAIRLVRD